MARGGRKDGGALPSLTVDERIILHLCNQRKAATAPQKPRAVTQDGIADAVGIYVTHVSRSVKKLRASGLVEEDMGHVSGVRRRRKVYSLTSAGHAGAVKMKKMLAALLVTVSRDGVRGETTLGELRDEIGWRTGLAALLERVRGGVVDVETLTGDVEGAGTGGEKTDSDEDAASGRGPRLVGRNGELAELDSILEPASAGRGRTVLVKGEAGVGKTRLINEWLERLPDCVKTLRGQCLYHQGIDPYLAFHEAFAGMTATGLSGAGKDRTRHEPGGEAHDQRMKVFAETLKGAASAGPIVLLIEDLHWADASTATTFHYLARTIKDQRVILIGTYRTEQAESPGGGHVALLMRRLKAEGLATTIALERLSAPETSEMGRELLGCSKLPPEFNSFLYAQSEGNPLYIEELVRTLREDGALECRGGSAAFTGPVPEGSVPRAIHELIMMRLDGLDPADRKVLEHASAQGLTFDVNTLRHTTDTTEPDVYAALDELEARYLIKEDGEHFRFYHALIQEVVYAGIGRSEKKMIHRRVGEHLEQETTGYMLASPALTECSLREHIRGASDLAYRLAYAFHKGGEPEKALRYTLAAARTAVNSVALEEALELYGIALELVDQLREEGMGAEMDLARIDILEGMGWVYQEVAEYTRALDRYQKASGICTKLQGSAYRIPRLTLSFEFGPFRSESGELEESGELVRPVEKKALLLQRIGWVHERRNDLESALDAYRESLRLSDANDDLLGVVSNLSRVAVMRLRTVVQVEEDDEFKEQALPILIMASAVFEYGIAPEAATLARSKHAVEELARSGEERRCGRGWALLGIAHYLSDDLQKARRAFGNAVPEKSAGSPGEVALALADL